MNVEELTFMVANLFLVRIHLLVHHLLLGQKKNNEIVKFPTSVMAFYNVEARWAQV